MAKYCGPNGCVDDDKEVVMPSLSDILHPKKFVIEKEYFEHTFQETFGDGSCGVCPFPRNHQIHVRSNRQDTKYIYTKEQWDRDKSR